MIASAPYRILLVEDSSTQALKFQDLMERQGWSVDWVPSAEEALDHLSRSSPNLIVVDYHLPGMNGDLLCRRIRMDIGARAIAILMLTSELGDSAELRGLDSGADDYLAKSSEEEVIVLKIRTLLRSSAALRGDTGQGTPFFRKARLLAVDDSATYLEFLKAGLVSEGYRIETAMDGLEAIKMLASETFDCVLLDLIMPKMDGIETCRRIAAQYISPENPLTVMVLTSRETTEELSLALEAGADDFVGKSSDISVIKGRIRALLRRKFFQQENQRIVQELKQKELDAFEARTRMEAAELRARMAEKVAHLAEELKRSNGELEQFANVASHDLSEPLRMVTSYLQKLEQKYKGRLDEQADRYIHYAVNGAFRMRSLIDDLLAYSRVGIKERPYEGVDCNKVLDQVKENLEVIINESGAEILCEKLLPIVRGDRLQIVQLMQNLVNNAVKFRGERAPKVTVEAWPDLSEENQPQLVRFSVRDNGIGIAERHEARIFQIFQRLHPRSKYDGTGIGLAICKKIVEQHGGEIIVKSAPDVGTEFQFTLCRSSKINRKEAES